MDCIDFLSQLVYSHKQSTEQGLQVYNNRLYQNARLYVELNTHKVQRELFLSNSKCIIILYIVLLDLQ